MAKSGTRSLRPSKAAQLPSRARSKARGAGSSLHGARRASSGDDITTVSRADPGRGTTDWAALDKLSDDEIAAGVRDDPDAVPLGIDWSEAVLVIPNKVPISIRLDPDVLAFFKESGRGYQRRINQVLRSYVEQRRGRR
jgi:uncharacterized protein (DUF4415 family)